MNLLIPTIATCLCIASCSPTRSVDPEAPYRVGVNFIRIGPEAPASGFTTADSVLDDLEELEAGGIRQLGSSDLSWFTTYVGGDPYDPDSYDFEDAEELTDTLRLYAIPTLFQQGPEQAAQYFAGGGGGTTNPTRKVYTPAGDNLATLNSNPDVLDAVYGYCTVIADRYKHTHQHFEIMNEVGQYLLFSAQDYGHLLQVAHNAIHAVRPDLNIVLGGLAGTTDSVFRRNLVWLQDVFDTLDSDGDGARAVIDVVNFHYYDSYSKLRQAIIDLKEMLADNNWDGPIWATELGRSRVKYTGPKSPGTEKRCEEGPHRCDDSEEEQAADVFRLLSVAFGGGIRLANWHTYISRTDSPNQVWGAFGLRRAPSGNEAKAYTSYKLFTQALGHFSSCREISGGSEGAGELGSNSIWAYLYLCPGENTGITSGEFEVRGPAYHRLVIWTDNPEGATYNLAKALEELDLIRSPLWPRTVSVTHVVPDSSGVIRRESMSTSDLALTTEPIMITFGLLF